MIGLGGAGISAEKIHPAIIMRQVNDFAFQLNIRLTSKIDNVLAELVRLRFGSREKDLVAPTFHRIHKPFPPKEHRRPNLARLVDIADTVFQSGAVPVFLVRIQPVQK